MSTAHESTPYPRHSGHGTPHVLVVDDDQAVAQPIASYFRRLGCATDVASEREEAEALAVYRRYDLAILDLHFASWGGPGGLDVLDEIGEHSPGTAVVVLSGHVTHDTLGGAPGRPHRALEAAASLRDRPRGLRFPGEAR
jgi:DNA-binding NtrC family response regulator